MIADTDACLRIDRLRSYDQIKDAERTMLDEAGNGALLVRLPVLRQKPFCFYGPRALFKPVRWMARILADSFVHPLDLIILPPGVMHWRCSSISAPPLTLTVLNHF